MKAIASRDNPTYKHLRHLADDGRYRRDQGRALLDGAHLLAAAIGAQASILRIVVAHSALTKPEIAGLLSATLASCETLELPDALFRTLSPSSSPTGVLAEIAIPSDPPVVDEHADVVVMDGVQDAGNLGTLLRTAAAVGITRAWLGEGCAQAWSPKVLRAGMGAHFHLHIEEHVLLAQRLPHFDGLRIATLLDAQSRPLYDCDLRAPSAWLFGAEGRGLSAELTALANTRVMIPMAPGTESLNVAAAAAVCMFEQFRQRQK